MHGKQSLTDNEHAWIDIIVAARTFGAPRPNFLVCPAPAFKVLSLLFIVIFHFRLVQTIVRKLANNARYM